MENKLRYTFKSVAGLQSTFWVFAILVMVSIFSAIATEWYFLAGIPAFLLLVYLTIVDFRKVFYLLLACIPLSTEIVLPNGFGTDLPTEPLMIGLMLVWVLYQLGGEHKLGSSFFRHPLTLLLLLHLSWVLVTTITSDLFFVSIKFFLAKIWYVVVFYFLAAMILKSEKEIKILFWVIFLPLMFTLAIILTRHATYGFSFEFVHKILHPFQRNHVNYAVTTSLFLPLVWMALSWYKKWSWKWMMLTGGAAILILATFLSYTRAAYVALLFALAAYFVIRFRLMKHVLALGLVVAIAGVVYMASSNRYLDYAPNYETTVSHYQFDNLMEATYKMEDISTMERLYRWVAAFHMSKANPVFGYGPGNFINFYESFTVTGFRTYVSRNKERSGIHSYFLMVLVEQGVLGLIIFFALTFYVLIKGEEVYHRLKNPRRKRILMAFLLTTIVIDAFLIINDLVETDKSGPYFFMTMAILVNFDLANRRNKE